MRRIALAAAAAAALTVTTPAGATTILTENFESGFGIFAHAGQVGVATGADYQVCCGTTGNTTNHFAAFGSGGAPGGTLTGPTINLTGGVLYTLTVDYGALGRGADTLTLHVDGFTFSLFPNSNNNLDTTFTNAIFNFTALGGSTALTITGGDNIDVDPIIDNISLTTLAVVPGTPVVPEPSTWAMMLLGFGAIGLTLRRRRRRLAAA